MKHLVLALAFLAVPAALWAADDPCIPTRMSLDEEPRERQDVEMERQRPDDSARLTPMEFFYRHSHLEAGAMYTDFDSSLALKSNLGFYVRYGVELAPNFSVHMTYRFATFGNTPSSAPVQEDVRVQALLFGASYHQPLMRDFAAMVALSVGPSWWDSNVVKSDNGLMVSGELALTARLWELLRLKAGIVVDGVNTDFHSASGTQLNLSWLVGVEIGL